MRATGKSWQLLAAAGSWQLAGLGMMASIFAPQADVEKARLLARGLTVLRQLIRKRLSPRCGGAFQRTRLSLWQCTAWLLLRSLGHVRSNCAQGCERPFASGGLWSQDCGGAA